MSLILNIDTAIDAAFISIAKDGNILQQDMHADRKDHAGYLQPAIHSLLAKANIQLSELDAVAVSCGPGSYTGLRVGMATAKGICYAINKPLVLVNSLEVLAHDAIMQEVAEKKEGKIAVCPMIDARRMEVFTAVYDSLLNAIMEPCALLLEESSFADILLKYNLTFIGNGAAKWQGICPNKNCRFLTSKNNVLAMSILSQTKFTLSSFSDIAYAEPTYIKEFYSNQIH